MLLRLERKYLKEEYTIGLLYVDGKYFCDTLEDKVRDFNKDGDLLDAGETKVYGKTAIPYGKYRITLDIQSPSFSQKTYYKVFCNGYLPRLLNVANFDGVLIHCGGTADHSAGCVLVGQNKVKGGLIKSKQTFERLYRMMQDADTAGEEIWMEIV